MRKRFDYSNDRLTIISLFFIIGGGILLVFAAQNLIEIGSFDWVWVQIAISIGSMILGLALLWRNRVRIGHNQASGWFILFIGVIFLLFTTVSWLAWPLNHPNYTDLGLGISLLLAGLILIRVSRHSIS